MIKIFINKDPVSVKEYCTRKIVSCPRVRYRDEETCPRFGSTVVFIPAIKCCLYKQLSKFQLLSFFSYKNASRESDFNRKFELLEIFKHAWQATHNYPF